MRYEPLKRTGRWLWMLVPVLLAGALLAWLGSATAAAPAASPIWVEAAQLIAGDGVADDEFGHAVAVEGSVVVVGALRADVNDSNSGAAYVFNIDGDTGIITPVAKLVVSDGTISDLFGQSVAISSEIIVVGAHQAYSNSQGRAYVFKRPVQGWSGTITESAVLRASDRGSSDVFGYSVAVDGDTIVVGARGEDEAGPQAGALYVFEEPAAGWGGTLEEDAKLVPGASPGNNGYLGNSVAIEGDVIVSGAYLASVDGFDDVGRGYVFVRPPGGWSGTLSETAELLADGVQSNDRLGVAVDISGGTIVMGAYLYEPPGPNSNHGALYVFEEPAGGWGGTVTETARLVAANPGSQEMLGTAVAMHGDVIVGGTMADEAAYVFTRPAGGWSGTVTEAQKLTDSAAGDNDFGVQIALDADSLVIGARYDDGVADNAGRAYLFTPNQVPLADAGTDQAAHSGAAVQLNGSASSDPDGNLPLSFGWEQSGGTPVTLSNAGAISPTFTAPDTAGVLTFTLTVTDALGAASAPDVVAITVTEPEGYRLYLPLLPRP